VLTNFQLMIMDACTDGLKTAPF